MSRKKLTDSEKLLYDIAYSYLDGSDETVKPDTEICIDMINDYFQKHHFKMYFSSLRRANRRITE